MRKWPGCGAASHGDGQSKRGLVFGACGGGGARERLRGRRWIMRRWPGCGAASCGDGSQKIFSYEDYNIICKKLVEKHTILKDHVGSGFVSAVNKIFTCVAVCLEFICT